MMSKEFLWVEKYRPKTVEDCILPPSLDKTFKDLTREAFMGLLSDTGADVAQQIEQAWFGN